MKIYLREKNGLLKLFEGDLTAELKQRQIIIGEGDSIGERASIGEEASIGALANIGEEASITMTYECIVLGPLGSRSAMMTAYVLNEIIQIGAGCFLDSIEKFESQVKEVHAGTRHEKEYLAALDYVRAKFAIKPCPRPPTI